MTWPSRATWLIGDLQSDLVNDLWYPNPDAMYSRLELKLFWLTDLRSGDGDARSDCWLVLQCWLHCSVDVFVFRFALVISDLVAWVSDLVICSVYWFFFSWEFVGLPYLFTTYWVVLFCLDWVCFTSRIDVGLFCGLALLHFFFFLIWECSSFC